MKTSKLAARLLATNDKAVESLDKQLESVQKQAETVDPDDKARKLDLQSRKVELEKRKLKLSPPKEKEKAMAIKRVVARLQEVSSSNASMVVSELQHLGVTSTKVLSWAAKADIESLEAKTTRMDLGRKVTLTDCVSEIEPDLGPPKVTRGGTAYLWSLPGKGRLLLTKIWVGNVFLTILRAPAKNT